MTPSSPVTIDQAMAAVQSAAASLANADSIQKNAQDAFDTAKKALDQADSGDVEAVQTWNAALDTLVEVANNSKRAV